MAKRGNNSLGRRTYGGKPYDANNSFVKKMATKVTDLIPQKSWISKWFNTSQDNGVENDRSPETEEDVQQPPAKRPRIRMDVTHPPGTFSIKTQDGEYSRNHDTNVADQTEEYFLEPGVAGPSGCKLVSSTPAVHAESRNSSSPRSQPTLMATNNGASNGADDNSESGESTSCCSSLIPQTNRQEGAPNSNYGSNSTGSRNRFIDDKSSFTNHLQSPRCLFLGSAGSRDSLSSRRPSFNPSMMNSNSGNNLDRTSSLSSPFYSGNVTFGGANAVGTYKRGRTLFNSTNEYPLKVPRRTSVQVKPSNSEIDASGMSQTAKRILEAMEYFSSPISDAKKIPIKKLEQTSGTKRSRDEIASPTTRVGLRHLTRELAVPTVPEMLKLRRRQKLQDTTVAARKIISAMSGPAPSSNFTTTSTTGPDSTANQEYQLRDECEDSKYQGKLWAKTRRNPKEEGPAPRVNLPNIALEIATLPSFEPLPTYTAPSISPARKDEEKDDSRCGYTFADPIKISEASWNLKSINNFTFSKPINANESSPPRANSVTSNVNDSKSSSRLNNEGVAMNFAWSGSSTAPRLKVKPKPENTIGPNEKSTIFDESTVKEMTKLSEVASRTKSPDHPFKLETIWECAECYIKNNSREKICLACKTPKPGDETSTRSNSNPTEIASPPPQTQTNPKPETGFGERFKMSAKEWECESCLVRNLTTSLKCVSCSSPKPNTGNGKKTETWSASNTLGKFDLAEKFKPAEGSWECPGCMLRNPSAVITCPCCSASKPSTTKANTKRANIDDTDGPEVSKESSAGETPKETLQAKFKPSGGSWECSSCLVRNNETASTCVCCSNPKPGESRKTVEERTPRVETGWGDKYKKPEGSWSCDSCMLQNKPETTVCVACNVAKPGSAPQKTQPAPSTFSFGIPASQQTFKFGMDKAESKPAWATDQQATKGVEFSSDSSRTNVDSGTFKFGIPKKTEKPEIASKLGASSSAGGFVFASPKTTTASDTQTETSKTVDGKSGSMPFVFGVPKSVKQSETVVEEKSKKEAPPAVTTESSKPLFVFGVPKTEGNSSSEKLRFGAGEKVSIFGSSQASNETVASVASKSASETKESEKPASSIPSTNMCPGPARTFAFSEPKSKPGQTSITPTFGQASVPASVPASTSTFSTGTLPETSSSDKTPSFGIPSSASTSFGVPSSSGTPTVLGETTDAKPFPETQKPTFFGISGDKSTARFGGGSPEKKAPVFGNPDNKMSSVFGANKPTITTNTIFNSAVSSTTSSVTATPAFGVNTSVTTQPVFGNTNTSVFGNNATSPSFGATSSIFAPAGKSSAAPAPSTNPSLFSFGGANTQQMTSQTTPGTFSFRTDTADSANPAKPIFAFGSTSSTQPNPGECFGAPGTNTGTFGTAAPTTTNPTPSPFTFNSPNTKQDPPPAFGQTSATIPNMFGTQTPTAIGQQSATPNFATNAAPGSSSFNFRPPAPTTGTFNFTGGMAQTPAPPSGGFNFNAPAASPNIAFDPNSRPVFNFTGGTAPTAFNAAPQPVPTRKIKKAVRRMQQR